MVFVGGARPPAPSKPRPFNGGARPPRAHPPAPPFNGGAAPPPSTAHTPPAGAAPPPTSATPPAPPATPPAAPAPSPLDATYYAQLQQAQFQAHQKVDQLNQARGFDQVALTQALQQLGDRQPVVEQNATNAANARGLLYSGALGSQIGDLKTAYVQNMGRQNDEFARRDAARTSEINATEDELPFQELASRLASIDRANKAAQTAALSAPALPAAATDALHVPRAQGHSTAYTGAGLYKVAGPSNQALRAVGHSVRYRGPGRYVPVGK